MKLIIFLIHFVAVWLTVLRPGGVRAIAAENIVLRKQLIGMSRNCRPAPKLTILDRVIYGFLTSMINVKRLSRIAITIKPATLLKFHKALVQRKYHLLFSNKSYRKPGPSGPNPALINAIIEMKTRNPRYGCRRIAMQISNAFGVDIDKDVVRRVLNKQFKDLPHSDGPSWVFRPCER